MKSGHASDAISEPNGPRLDEWLWMVRVFKTRDLAAEACKSGHVTVNGRDAKPAQTLRPGQLVEVRQGMLSRRLVMLICPPGRQAAARLGEFVRDETPPEVYARAAEARVQQRLAGAIGKSADKRERRERRAFLDGP
jgi:ribosome-associated heat shock protein Hsp15